MESCEDVTERLTASRQVDNAIFGYNKKSLRVKLSCMYKNKPLGTLSKSKMLVDDPLLLLELFKSF
jgi:hypothetical protein